MKNLYDVLEVSRYASNEIIEKAYKTLAKKYHPDLQEAEKKQEAEEMMKKLQITHLSKRCYRELSGGQQQRVLLARALCATRKILLLDEPVSGLDPQMTEEMYRLIEKINREDKITIIMISHDIRGAMEYASHILQIGQEVIFESKENYLRAHTKRSVLGNTGGKK